MGTGRALLLALLLGLTGCGGSDSTPGDSPSTTVPPSTSTSTSSSPTSSSTSDLSPPTQQELDRAARRVLRAATIDFGYDLLVSGSRIIELDGTWRRDPIGWASEAEFDDDPSSLGADGGLMRTTSVGDELWMQMDQWPQNQRKCWLPMAPGTVPVGINALVPGIPGPLRLLGSLRARPDGSEVLLAGAVSMLTVQTISAFGLDRYESNRTVTVPAYVLVKDDVVSEIRVKGVDINAALPTPLPPRQAKVLRLIDLELSYDPGESSYDIDRPAPETTTPGCGS